MTVDDLLTEVAFRLGDTSTAFKTEIAGALQWVLRDLAQHESIGRLRKTKTFSIVQDQRNYDLQTITGLTTPDYPVEFESVVVREWGWPTGLIKQAETDMEMERLRLEQGETFTGKWMLWNVRPDADGKPQLFVQPPGGGQEAGDTVEVTFCAPPDVLTGTDVIAQVYEEDLETLVYGVQARLAFYKEETQGDFQRWMPLYFEGRAKMWGRTHNQGFGRIQPQEP